MNASPVTLFSLFSLPTLTLKYREAALTRGEVDTTASITQSVVTAQAETTRTELTTAINADGTNTRNAITADGDNTRQTVITQSTATQNTVTQDGEEGKLKRKGRWSYDTLGYVTTTS